MRQLSHAALVGVAIGVVLILVGADLRLVLGVALVVVGFSGLILMIAVFIAAARARHDHRQAYHRAGSEARHWPADVGGGWE